MIEASIPDIEQLVNEGQAAVTAGDMIEARERFRRVLEQQPGHVEALLGMSTAVPMLAEKKRYLQQALASDPQHTDARESLAYVEKLLSQGMQLAPSKRREVQIESSNASPLLSAPAVDTPAEVMHCYRHADRETGLQCTNCGRAICAECAKAAAVGQLCPECRKERRPTSYKVAPRDLTIGGVVAFLTSTVVAVALTLALAVLPLGFFGFIIMMLVGPAIAEFIVRVVDRVTKAKRGRGMQIAVGGAIALGTLPLTILFQSLLLLLFLIVAISVATARLR